MFKGSTFEFRTRTLFSHLNVRFLKRSYSRRLPNSPSSVLHTRQTTGRVEEMQLKMIQDAERVPQRVS